MKRSILIAFALCVALPAWAGDIQIFARYCEPLPGSLCTLVTRTDGVGGDVPLRVMRCPPTGQADFVCDYVVSGWVNNAMAITAATFDWMMADGAVDNFNVSWLIEAAAVVRTAVTVSAFQVERPSVALATQAGAGGSDWIKTAAATILDGDLHFVESPGTACSTNPGECRGRLLRLIMSRCNASPCDTGNSQEDADLVFTTLSVSE
jgi:hypothetical protein